MATTIPCTVDTTPMAQELQSVSSHVNGTTAAVVTMQSAVIAAENNSANKVCANVNRGFFTLVRSQISQKIANKQSRVEALFLQLGQQKRRLLSIKSAMERDYGRVAANYMRTFTNINKELEKNIRELDQPVFDLVNRHVATSSNRMNALSGIVSTSQVEGIAKSQQILVSEMKHNAQLAISQATDFLTHIGEQRVLTEQILISQPDDNSEKTCHIPVIISETVSDAQQNVRTEICVPEGLSGECATRVRGVIRSKDDLSWGENNASPLVGDEFARLLDESKASPRVKELIRKLYDKGNFETL